MLDDLVRIVRKHASAFDAVEMQRVSRNRFLAEVERGDATLISTSDTADTHLRLFRDGRVTVFGMPGDDAAALEAMLGRAATEIDLLPKDEHALPPEDAGAGSGMSMEDPLYSAINAGRIRDLAFDIEVAAYAADSRVSTVRKATFEKERVTVELLDVHGRTRSYTKTFYSSSVEVMAGTGGQFEVGYEAVTVNRAADINTPETGQTAAKRAVELLGAKPLASGQYRILMSRDVAAEFVDLVGSMLNGEEVLRRRSMFAGSIDKPVASPCFSLVDDAGFDGIGGYPFDDEGTPGSRTELIREGVLASCLHNAYTARSLGMDNTGNAHRSANGVIGVSPSNLIVIPGNAPAWDGAGSVLVVTSAMGMHTADPVSGEFSVGIAGYLAENGSPGAPFREMVLSGNLRDLLNRIIAVGNNPRDFGGIITPDILFDAMSVGGI